MKKVKPNKWLCIGIICACIAIILMKLPIKGSNWLVFTATLLAILLMAFSFSKSNDKE
jgi:hypothetical protein